jgi:anti-anti-sigma regulatory factor
MIETTHRDMLVFFATGRLSTDTVSELSAALEADDLWPKVIVLDLGQLDHVDSGTLDVVLERASLLREGGRELVVVPPRADVVPARELAHLNGSLRVAPHFDSAGRNGVSADRSWA